jgi:hypothetical protein
MEFPTVVEIGEGVGCSTVTVQLTRRARALVCQLAVIYLAF